MPCGFGDTHCCSIGGKDCPHLRAEPGQKRKWVCTLREELGDWDLVHADPRYQRDVRAVLDNAGATYGRIPDCRDWPPDGVPCHECGANGGGKV